MKSKEDRAKDIVTKGLLELRKGGILTRWVDGRSYPRATYELWDDDVSSSEGDSN